MTQQDALAWFDIQVQDFEAAQRFYSAVINADLTPAPDMPGTAFFPFGEGKVGGSLTHNANVIPGNKTVTVHLTISDDIESALLRVVNAGGTVTTPSTPIPEGYIASFEDLEGNTVGMFATK
ncbi:MAG: VOC family protein [Chloroflexota bacterium]